LRKTIPFARTNEYIDQLEDRSDTYVQMFKDLVEQRDENAAEADATRNSLESVTAYHNRFVGDFVKYKERCEQLERENDGLRIERENQRREIDAKIKQLEAQAAGWEKTARSWAAERDDVISEQMDRNSQLRAALSLAKRELESLKRLRDNKPTHSQGDVASIHEEDAIRHAAVAQRSVTEGVKVSFTGACLARVKTLLDEACERNRTHAQPVKQPNLLLDHYIAVPREQWAALRDFNFRADASRQDSPLAGVFTSPKSSVFDPCANGNNGR
jgi:hypothetical protein